MHILLISHIHQDNKFGQQPPEVGSVNLSPDQPQYSWYKALQNMGHEVEVVSCPVFVNKGGTHLLRRAIRKLQREAWQYKRRQETEKKVEQLFREIRPDVVLISGGSQSLGPKCIVKAREKYGFKVIFFHGLSPKYSPVGRDEITTSKIAEITVCNSYTHAKHWDSYGANQTMALPYSASDLSLQGNIARRISAPIADVGLVGSIGGKLYENRVRILSKLREYNLAIWAPEGSRDVLQKHGLENFYKGALSRTECPAIYSQCKMMLNIHNPSMADGGNLSTFEIPASGGFQVIDHYWPEWFIEGKEVVSFSSIEQLKQLIDYYLKHEEEREEIAQRGRERTLRDHTYEKRFEKLFSLLEID
jgi:spore maturation protein CgeB